MAHSITGILFCAKCHKPVDNLETTIDPMTGDYIFIAFCHGKSESTVLTRKEVADAIRIDCATAFAGPDRVDAES